MKAVPTAAHSRTRNVDAEALVVHKAQGKEGFFESVPTPPLFIFAGFLALRFFFCFQVLDSQVTGQFRVFLTTVFFTFHENENGGFFFVST